MSDHNILLLLLFLLLKSSHELIEAFSSWQALAKTLTVAQLAYLREQFTLLGPNKSGFISMQNFKTVSTCPKFLFLFQILYKSLTFTFAGCFKERH